MRPQPPRERRTLVHDAGAGLTLELTVTDVTGAQRGEAATTGPFAILGVSVIRNRDGQPAVSHGIVRAVPFASRSGWTTPASRVAAAAAP